MDLSQEPKEVQELFEQARKNTQPRKHHIVPASYLRRWTVEGKVRVHLLDQNKSIVSKPSNAARETDYYRAESDQLDPDELPPMIFETMLNRVETPAVGAIDELMKSPERISLQARYDLAKLHGVSETAGPQ